MHPSIKNSINKTRVLQEIRKRNGISRIEIAKILNLDKSTISKITSDLLEQNLILDKKSSEESTHAGRKRISLGLNNEYGVVIGIDIQTEYYNVVVINLSGEMLLNYRERQPDLDFLDSFDFIIKGTILKCEEKYNNILGIGVGIPGHVDPKKGIIFQSNPLNITEPLNIYSFIKTKYKYPIYLDNDANCCCWGDLTFRNGKVNEDFIVALGEIRSLNRKEQEKRSLVVGLGIVIGGKVHTGINFSAGEFKSIFWENSQVSQFSISNETAGRIPGDRNKTVNAIEELLKHLALFSNSFNLTKVVFAGVFNDYKVDITRLLKKEISRNWGYPNDPEVEIIFTPFGDYDVSYGSAGMVVERIFTLPDITSSDKIEDLAGMDLINYISNSGNFVSHAESMER
ncbi:MAG: ROK family transcriptional regulator [Spirochaetales bacterium]|nr:ROK family transcriptional regulator [Spirochaetales bacterium]